MFITNKDYTSSKQKAITDLFEDVSRNAPSMYKVSKVHFIANIPRTSVGKVKRFCLTVEDAGYINSNKEIDVSNSTKLINIIETISKIKDVKMDSKIAEDLGLDSLTTFEIVCEIENTFHVDIASEISKVTTVEDLYNLIGNEGHSSYNVYPKEKSKKMINSINKWIAFSKSTYEIEAAGVENIPSNHDYIICANHESYFDPIWILAAMDGKANLDKICCMAAKHTMETKSSCRFFEALGGIPVDREGNTIPAMNCAKRCLDNRRTLIVFPEGARSRDGSMLSFKNGAAALAVDTNKKILPVSTDGSFEIFPRWIKYPRIFNWKHFRKYPLQISFGSLIEPNGKTVEEITVEIRQRIVEMKEQPK